ncbi:hypothetical protein GCM10023074_59530 [Microbispora amethystogenes]|uniref:Uncharacterized protein n=1 Tax=Microbispora amethystogenes TaxID=1427754 RepID=A0ABQ4F6L2_9ACTN|nr:hypothetical protein Mam01_06000 [Microbispora amethystogenes]
MSTSHPATEPLEALAEELRSRNFSTRIVIPLNRIPQLQVMNPAAPALTEQVLAKPDSHGAWHYWFPWPTLIAAVDDIPTAADRIERVLAEVGRNTGGTPGADAPEVPASPTRSCPGEPHDIPDRLETTES